MQVLITTSPLACVASPPRSPKTVNPSSRTRTIASGMLHHALRDHLAATDGHNDPSPYPSALKRRVLAAASEGRRVNRPLGSRIDQDPFVLQRLTDDLSRPRDARPIDGAPIEAEPEDDSNGRLEAVEAVGTGLLRGLVMRRLIGRDHIDHPVDEGLAQ